MPSTNTTNFNLIKPGQEEFYNVDVPNTNMDTIDGVLKALQDAINSGASEQDLTTLRDALTTHLADNEKHVTPEKRAEWNAKEDMKNKNQAGGYVGLDANKKIDPAQLPDETRLDLEYLKIDYSNY